MSTGDADFAIEVESFFKTFKAGFFHKKVEAVRGISFRVQRGEIFGLLGPNGAGKTTTIKSMMGLIRVTKGAIRIGGVDASRVESRRDVGYLPENPYFHEHLTPQELLDFFGRLWGMDRRAIAARRDELIEQVGLKAAAKRPLRKFSKGMLQRIGLAQALLVKPSLLVLDEPMSGLDPIGRKLVSDLIIDLNRKGTTILFSSHILSDVERLCHRVAILNLGELVAQGTLGELLRAETETATLEELFVRKAFATQDAAM